MKTRPHRSFALRSSAFPSALSAALAVTACVEDTSQLGVGSVDANSADAATPLDAEPVPDIGPADLGVLPEEWAVVPCPASAMRLLSPGLIAGNGPMEGILTVFVSRYPPDAPWAGSRVVLEQDGRTLEGLTDERGCVRFVGAGLTGPAQITISATDHTMTIVRGLSFAQADVGILARTAVSQRWLPPETPAATISGVVTGFERMPSVTSTSGESHHIQATVTPIYRRRCTNQPYVFQPAVREAPHADLQANVAYLGYAYGGMTPYVDLRDFVVPAAADDLVGVQVQGSLGRSANPDQFTHEVLYVGATLGLSAQPGQHLENVSVDLAVPNTRRLVLSLPERPTWAGAVSVGTSLYLPGEDAFLFPAYLSSNPEPQLRPELTGPLLSAEEVVVWSAGGVFDVFAPSMQVSTRTRSEQPTPPSFPARPEVGVSHRRLEVSFAGPRDGAALSLGFISSIGGLFVYDLGAEQSFEVDLPDAHEELAIPDLDAELQVGAFWPATEPADHAPRLHGDSIDARARYREVRSVNLARD